MAGASSLQQAPDPPDPGADNLGSGSPLHSSQFPPLSHSPEAASKPQASLPVLPFSPWSLGKLDTPALSPDNRTTTMVDLESPSTTMDISPTTVPIQISGKGLEQIQIFPSAKSKEINFISRQDTTLSTKRKGTTSPTAAILFGTVVNPNTDIITILQLLESPKDLPPVHRTEVLLSPCYEPPKVAPPPHLQVHSQLVKLKPSPGSAELLLALGKAIFSQDSQAENPFSPAIGSLVVGPQVAKPYINVSSSKKRKGSHLSRRSSPETNGGNLSVNLFSGISLANPFLLLETHNLGHLSATAWQTRFTNFGVSVITAPPISLQVAEAILSTISSTIKNRLSSLRESDPSESSACMQLWFSLT
ncbi:hypothetical protein Bca4012_029248 [Brassica carinata]